jgi:hypothetical protein
MIKPSDFAEIQKLCLRSFPERLEQRISGFETRPGHRRSSLGFTLSWREGRSPRVERLALCRYEDQWTWWKVEDRAKAEREWAVMRWLYGEGLPLPELYAVGTEESQPFLLMSQPAGEETAAERCAGALAALLAHLHRLSPPARVSQLLPSVDHSAELERLADVARAHGNQALIEALDVLCSTQVEEYPPCVVRGNLSSDHLLCDARGITALLGWENSALGDPRWDVARVENELLDVGDSQAVHEFRTAYQDHGGRPLTHAAFWQALVATQSWTMASWAVTQASPSDETGLSAYIEAWRGRAWRALIRLRHETEEGTQTGVHHADGTSAALN